MSEHETLAAALAAFQAHLPTIDKGQTAKVKMKDGGSYSYSYADLEDVSAVVMPLLAKQGLSFSARPTFDGDRFVLAYALLHTSGEREDGTYPLPNTTPQQVGSAITYARRYCLCAVTGVAPGGDDDGRAAQQAQSSGRDSRSGQSNGDGPTCAKCGEGLAGVPVAKVDGQYVHKDGCPTVSGEGGEGTSSPDINPCETCGPQPRTGKCPDCPGEDPESLAARAEAHAEGNAEREQARGRIREAFSRLNTADHTAYPGLHDRLTDIVGGDPSEVSWDGSSVKRLRALAADAERLVGELEPADA